MKAKAAFFAIVLALATPLSHAAGCVVENDEIAVVGALSRETFAGPPNYESVERGDAAETVWILTVREPIALCVVGAAEGKSRTTGSLSRFQLVLDEKEGSVVRALIARHAWVRGRVFLGHTGHHHVGALIEVTGLRPATQSPFESR